MIELSLNYREAFALQTILAETLDELEREKAKEQLELGPEDIVFFVAMKSLKKKLDDAVLSNKQAQELIPVKPKEGGSDETESK